MAEPSKEQIRILHIDDDPNIADLTKTFLERENDQFTVDTATDVDDGLAMINDCRPDCVISDYNMPGMDGIEFLQAVREDYPDLPFILYTGRGSEAVASEAIAADVTDYLQKDSGTGHYTILANRISNAVGATRSAAEAEERRRRLEQILKTAPGCVVQLDADGRFVFANKRAEEVLGLRSDELTQRTYNDPEWELENLNGEPIPDEELPFRRVCDTGETVSDAIHTVVWPDGSRKILSVNAAPLFNETGDIESVVASINDITEQRERQRELGLFKQAIEDAADGVAIIDDEERYVYVDRTHVDMYGFSGKDQLLGNTWRKLYDNDEIERLEREAFPALEADGHWHGTVTGSRPDGSTFPAELSLTAVGAGRVVCTVRDDTEHRQREQRFQALVEESNDIISVVDSNGQFQYQSPSIERILGYTPGDTVGDRVWEYIHPDDRERIAEQFETWVQHPNRMSESVEYRARHADGSWHWMEAEGNDQLDNPAVEGYVINSRDITDRRERQRELGLLQQAIDDANVPITLADPSQPDEPLVYVNDAFEETTGYSSEGTLGRNCRFLQGEDTDPEKNAALREAIDNEKQLSVELCNYRKDGTKFWNRLTVTPIYDDNDNLVRYLGTQENITDQRKREQELESEQRFIKQALDVLDDLFYVIDTDGTLQRWNAKVLAVTGHSEPELNGMPAIELFPEDERETVTRSIETVLTDGQDIIEADLFAADGRHAQYEFTGARLADKDGNTTGIVGIGRDVTDGKGRKYGKFAEEYEALLETSGDAIFLLDVDTTDEGSTFKFARLSPGYETQTGILTEEVRGKTPQAVFGNERGSELETNYTRCVEQRAPVSYREEFDIADDARFWETTLTPVIIADEVIRIVGIARNVTAQVEQERELQRQNERLDEFTSIVSHDLRSPLTVAAGNLELAQETCESEHLRTAADAIDRSQTLISDLLMLAREGEGAAEVGPVVLGDVAESCWETTETKSSTLDTDATQEIQADRSRLQQLFENLYRNAVEHSNDNVTVSIGTLDDGFYVEDNGPGIPEDERDDVFDAGYSTIDGGTGFGLNIVKEVADAHGWDIDITERTDGGARFEITGVEAER